MSTTEPRKRGPRPRPPGAAISLADAVAAASLGARRAARGNDLAAVEALAPDAPLAALVALPAVTAALDAGQAMPLSRAGLLTALRAELLEMDAALRALGVEPPPASTQPAMGEAAHDHA